MSFLILATSNGFKNDFKNGFDVFYPLGDWDYESVAPSFLAALSPFARF